ncbi:MAG TPA: S8 family serine peptidase, partial [Caulobacteraceae bacterium]|nr:S8 family serine peptidase [Caulobacteraceae bacterium]
MSKLLLAGASALAIATAGQAAAADRSAPWQAQIGDTATVQTMSKGGAGITIAIVDTGVLASNPEIYGRVSSLSSCAAVTFSCANGYTDDNSHGTAVAAIAGGKYSATAPISMSGVAPAATIIAEKVLSASGTGYSTDVANGIIKAADAGAKVINLSLTYSSSSTVVKAINYATAKGAVIVWAGGNSATNFNGGANTTGLTTASLQRMIFVGSVSSTNVISSFSNKPGTASAYAGSTSAKYSSLWLVAPGQGIIAPYATNGNNSFSAWTGTSMSAPEVAGGVALLEAAWPILYTKGTASIVL